MSFNGALAVCQSGFEGLLAREMGGLGLQGASSGPGWVLAGPAPEPVPGSALEGLRRAAFPHAVLESPAPVAGESVNALAQGVLDLFAGGLRGERIESPWPCVFAGSQDAAGLGRRAVVDLIRAGVLEELPGRRTCDITTTSLEVWLANHGMDPATR